MRIAQSQRLFLLITEALIFINIFLYRLEHQFYSAHISHSPATPLTHFFRLYTVEKFHITNNNIHQEISIHPGTY